MPVGNVDEVLLGPGALYVATVATSDPASASAALSTADWREIGWTESGTTFEYELSADPIEVAEEFDPVKYATTARRAAVTFQMAQTSRQNLALALNAGASDGNTAAWFEPPEPGTEVRVKIVLDTEEGARWVFRRCFQSSPLSMQRAKSPQKSLIPVTFRLEKPTGESPLRVFPTATGQV
jgi:hypothetical protein